MNISTLRTYIRDLTGIYSTDLLPNTLLDRWIEEAHTEVNEVEDWYWRHGTDSGTLSLGSTGIPGPVDFSGRVRQIIFIYPTDVIVQLVSSNGLLSTDFEDMKYLYTVDSSNDIVFLEETDDEVDYVMNYITETPSVDFVGTDFSVIPEKYQGVIAYRVAIKVLNSQSDDSSRKELYAVEFTNMLDLMRIAFVQEDDLGEIQIGGSALRVDGRTVGRLNSKFRSS